MAKAKANDKKIIDEALERFKLISDAEHDVREEAQIDLKFKAGIQWKDDISATRRSENRPCLTINRLPQFIRQVTNEQRMNRPAIRVSATDDATKDKAKIVEGLIRHIQVKSNADVAYDTACDYQVTMGFGYIRVAVDYCNDQSFEQEIKIEPIKNPFTVYLDPVERGLEKEYGFIVEDMRRKDFEREYGADKSPGNTLTSQGDDIPGWATDETVRVAEYWRVVKKPKTIYQLSDGSIVDKVDEEQLAALGLEVVQKRETTDRKVMWYKITGTDILDEKEWPGKYIPIVPVIGDEVVLDGKRMVFGMVRFARDPQRMYNYWASAQAEAIALAPKAPFIAAEGQLENYMKQWGTSNTKSHTTLIYRPVTQGGILLPPPTRSQAEPPVQAMVQAMAQASEDLKNTTGIHDASLGARSNETSGKAILARQKEGDVSNFHFVDNLSRSMCDVGTIINELLPSIYDTPRVVRILHENNEEELIKINEMFDKGGEQKLYDLTTGDYDIVVETGPSYSTKRQEAAQNILNISQSNPEIWQWAPDILFRNMDMAGSDELAERAKLILPPQIQQAENKDQAKIPPQVQQQLMQSHQMIEQLTQALNAANDQLDTKKIELESKERIAAQNNATAIAIAEIKNNMGLVVEELAHIREREKLLQADRSLEESIASNRAAQPMGEQDVEKSAEMI